jgi:hypothetical protein
MLLSILFPQCPQSATAMAVPALLHKGPRTAVGTIGSPALLQILSRASGTQVSPLGGHSSSAPAFLLNLDKPHRS